MSGEQTWRAQMEACSRGDWDAVYFAPGCTWTLMPPGTTFRGAAEIEPVPAYRALPRRSACLSGHGRAA